MDRRVFIARVSSLLAGTSFVGALPSILTGCTTLPEMRTLAIDGKIIVPFSQFTDGTTEYSMVMVHVQGLRYPIVLVRSDDAPATALHLVCTHKACPLEVEATGYTCSCHGSAFDRRGAVLNGPAKKPLVALPVETRSSDYVMNLSG